MKQFLKIVTIVLTAIVGYMMGITPDDAKLADVITNATAQQWFGFILVFLGAISTAAGLDTVGSAVGKKVGIVK